MYVFKRSLHNYWYLSNKNEEELKIFALFTLVMFVIVIKRGLVVGRHDFHHIEYAITCSFSFLSSGRLGFTGWRIFGVERMLYFCNLSHIGGGLEVCMFPGWWFHAVFGSNLMAWLNNFLINVLLLVLSEVPGST